MTGLTMDSDSVNRTNLKLQTPKKNPAFQLVVNYQSDCKIIRRFEYLSNRSQDYATTPYDFSRNKHGNHLRK